MKCKFEVYSSIWLKGLIEHSLQDSFSVSLIILKFKMFIVASVIIAPPMIWGFTHWPQIISVFLFLATPKIFSKRSTEANKQACN